ncbi:MAG: NADH:ubiquinone oxidoreductase subunit RnfE [Ruminococcaceae bacterium]|nr:NADH:ubiquinone oxidoreductase subunit RnfE [Oscillospiraceae bacterium]
MATAKQIKPKKIKQKTDFKFTRDLLDGLAKQNVVLMTGIVNAPVIIAATSFKKGVVIAIAFAIISFLTILTCSFIPKKIVYTLRVIIYALVGSVYYIPTVLLLERIFPLTVQLIGIYMPLLIANALIFSKTESRFYLESKQKMVIDVIMFIIGFGVICVLTGGFREVICFGTFAGVKILDISISAFEAPFGGFILVGIMAGMFRALYNYLRNRRIKQNEELARAEALRKAQSEKLIEEETISEPKQLQ